MILHPGILALIGGSAFLLLMTFFAVLHGVTIVRKWDFASSSAEQISLERKTYLISTIMNYVLGFQIAAAFLFVFTLDDIHRLFVGAMCATGSLNANPVGWYALCLKIVLFFLSGIWIALNHIDGKAEDYPLVRPKYVLLILLFPLFCLDLYLLVRYFLGLDPVVITSCCGSLFGDSGDRVASTMASLPVLPTMATFYGGILLYFVVAGLCLYSGRGILRYALSGVSVGLLFVSIASVISFISVYFYELPTHHCPFDILQAGYHFVGYPLYVGMFGGTFFGILPGCFQGLKKIGTLQEAICNLERTYVRLSMGFMILFVLVSSYPVVTGEFTLFG
ncbi:MAG: hypothetical protein HKM86_08885 [Deltaproteobacteria bacterium]|nr:hypothetical protein [Deltaproteobacteria bacterium]